VGDRLLAPSAAGPQVPPRDQAEAVERQPHVERPSRLGWGVAIGAFLVICAVVPEGQTAELPAKAAALLVLGAAGLPFLVVRALGRGPARRAASEVWAARLAVAFVVVALLSTLNSVRPVLAVVGLYDQFTGLLFIAAMAGCWAIGTGLTAPDRRLLESAFIAAAVVNAVVALFQEFFNLGTIGLYSYASVDPDGLLGNPVFFGAVLAASLALIGPRFVVSPRRWWFPAALITVGLGIGGERLPAILAVAVALWGLLVAWWAWRRMTPSTGSDPGPGTEIDLRTAMAWAGAFAAVVIGGILLGSLIARIKSHAGVTTHLAQSTAGETFGQRFAAWKAGLHAIAHHPLLGWGPGQFRAANTPYWPLSEERLTPNMEFADAHNFLIEFATTVGLIGLALLIGWLVMAFWNRRGPLVVFALVMLVMELAEPLHVALLPMAMLGLGAALLVGPTEPPDEPAIGRRVRLAAVVLAAVAFVPAMSLIVGDAFVQEASTNYAVADEKDAVSDANVAERLLSPWDLPATLLSDIRLYQSYDNVKGAAASSLYWAKVAAGRDPTNAPILVSLANIELYSEHVSAAYQAALQAEKAFPWYGPALSALGTVAYDQHHMALARHWFKLSLRSNPNQPDVKAILKGQCAPREPGPTVNFKDLFCGERKTQIPS
jgi:O-antigen ligase